MEKKRFFDWSIFVLNFNCIFMNSQCELHVIAKFFVIFASFLKISGENYLRAVPTEYKGFSPAKANIYKDLKTAW